MKSVEQYFNSFYSEVEKYVDGIHIFKESISEEEMCWFEETYNICLPYYYREWLKKNNGGEMFAVPAGTNIAGVLGKGEAEKGEIYLEDNFIAKKRPLGIPRYMFIIADNSLGDIIGFDLRHTNKTDGVVVYWNYETGKISEKWNSLAEWLDSIMECGEMLVNYDGSESDFFN